MKLYLRIFIIISTFLLYFSNLTANSDPSDCYKDLQLNFFQEELVYQALSIYRIPQGLWARISGDLKSRSSQIPGRMRQATARLVPNPLDYPMQKEFASKLLKKTLMNVFYETMSQYQVNERPTADFAFDYIFAQQLPKFIDCFGENARKLAPTFE